MKIKKIYLRKKASQLKCNKYLIIECSGALNNKTAPGITEQLFKGGSFARAHVAADKKNNLLKFLEKTKTRPVCLFYKNRWYLGNYIKQKNLLKQKDTVLSLLCKLRNKIK